jgi:hypothetical protein
MSNPLVDGLSIQDYVSKLEDALVDVLDGEQAHDLKDSTGLPEDRCEELCNLTSSIIKRGVGNAVTEGIIGFTKWEKEATLRSLSRDEIFNNPGDRSERAALRSLILKMEQG